MRTAIIELGGSHDECLYSQIKIIKSMSSAHLTLICNKSLEENVKHLDSVDKKVFVSLRNGYIQWVDLLRLWYFCRAEKFDKIIFNTAQGKIISRLIWLPFNKFTKFYGILHDTRKISSSYSQKSISKKIEHYFILSEYLKNNMKGDISFSVFYPAFFPEYPYVSMNKKEDDIWICIPGQVEFKRRDYKTLFESIKRYGINKNIKFVLLGPCGHAKGDGTYIKQQILNLGSQDNFLMWETFIPVALFHSIVRMSDYILPLIHEGDASGELYKFQITGAFNIAVGYKKPLLIEKKMGSKLVDYRPILYNKLGIMKTINLLDKNNSVDPYDCTKWSFEFQKRTYLKSLGIPLPD